MLKYGYRTGVLGCVVEQASSLGEVENKGKRCVTFAVKRRPKVPLQSCLIHVHFGPRPTIDWSVESLPHEEWVIINCRKIKDAQINAWVSHYW